MARTLDLRKYQEDILGRLKERAQPGEVASSSRLGVKVGRSLLLVSLEDISEVAPVPEIHPVPLAKPWFLGMSNVRGNLYGVSDMAQLAGDTPTTLTASSRVLLSHQKYKANVALLVNALLGLRNLDQMQEQEIADEGPYGFGGRQFKDSAGDTWRELNMRDLLVNPDFLKVGIG
ncbi:MAG TPA: chemotaxis protein CheW [Methylophilaceae bacterium]|nr:chemotaxis protein CheW [Methylophilaceae bacterium]HQR60405.1 chemotaxis protein CheW [Methylophilaceae bacterium]